MTTMNNKKFNEELLSRTNYTKEQVEIIDNILGKHFIIGKNNQKKMIADFVNELKITEEEGDELYNTCMQIIMENVKEKITHPFKKDK